MSKTKYCNRRFLCFDIFLVEKRYLSLCGASFLATQVIEKSIRATWIIITCENQAGYLELSDIYLC